MPPLAPGLSKTAARSVAISSATQLTQIILQLVGMVVLARLLTPKDYGLFALAMVVIGLTELLRDFGMSTASIRSAVLTTAQRDTLFWANTALGVVLGAIAFLCAPLFAGLLGDARLTVVIRCLTPLLVVGGMTTQHTVSLTRELRFKDLARIQITSAAAALVVGIVAATLGAEYWSLVIQSLFAVSLTAVLTWERTRWWPGRPRRQIGLGPIARFGLSLFGSAMISFSAKNFDSMLIGAKFGATTLGQYNRATQLVKTPFGQIQGPVFNVAVPVMARVVDDPAKLLRAVRDGQMVLAYPILWAVAIIATCPEAVISIALGNTWLPAAPMLTFLAVAFGLSSVDSVGGWLYIAKGAGRPLLFATVTFTLLDIGLMWAGSLKGAVGVAAGLAVSRAVAWPLTLALAGRATQIKTGSLIWSGAKIATIALAAAAASEGLGRHVLVDQGPLVTLTAATVAATMVFALAALLPAVRADYRVLLQHLRNVRR